MNISKRLPTITKLFYPKDAGMVQYTSIGVLNHTSELEDKNYLIISVSAETAFNKIQHAGRTVGKGISQYSVGENVN